MSFLLLTNIKVLCVCVVGLEGIAPVVKLSRGNSRTGKTLRRRQLKVRKTHQAERERGVHVFVHMLFSRTIFTLRNSLHLHSDLSFHSIPLSLIHLFPKSMPPAPHCPPPPPPPPFLSCRQVRNGLLRFGPSSIPLSKNPHCSFSPSVTV